MYYIIKERYGLRGWDDIPYALYDFTSGSVQVLDALAFNTLSLCNGKVDSIALLPVHLEAIEQLRKFGIIEECGYGCELQEYQKYKAASCKFILSAHWSITGKCNLKCKHCYMSAPQKKYGELTKEQCFDIIDKLSQANIYRVALTGGEPLVHENFWDIVDKLSSSKIYITQIYTNGVLVNQNLLDHFKKRNLNPEFSVSFDGIGCHDWLRGIDGAEKSVIKAIKTLVSNDFRVSAEMSLNKNNRHSLYDSVVFLADLGVSHIKVTPTSESGNWLKENGEYTLQTPELYDTYLDFIKKYKKANAPVSIMLGGFFSCEKGSSEYSHPFVRHDGSEKMLNRTVCGSAQANMYIAADGKLLPCIPLTGLPIQDTMPNINDMSIADALSNSTYIKAVNATLNDLFDANAECGSCEYRLYCGGGCRAGALIGGQPYLGKDEAACYFFRNNFEQKIKSIYQ